MIRSLTMKPSNIYIYMNVRFIFSAIGRTVYFIV
jgi:hypothetical protein